MALGWTGWKPTVSVGLFEMAYSVAKECSKVGQTLWVGWILTWFPPQY